MAGPSKQPLLASLPAVHELLEDAAVRDFLERVPRPLVVGAIQAVLDEERQRILGNDAPAAPVPAELTHRIVARLESALMPGPHPVINATGVILHTNLGRAPLAEAALQRMVEVGRGYSDLEMDVAAGKRGSRHVHVEEMLKQLTGAEAAFAVNNGAGAVLLALSVVVREGARDVIVSRGELVEIGGSFRVPDIMEASGARLCEVGTTNRTHLKDYDSAIGDTTAALLKVHQSNFQIVGFSKDVSLSELAELAHGRRVPLIVDLGSGCLVDLTPSGLEGEPVAARVVADGPDVVTFSGDKLLGGPQAGIVVGRAEWVERMRRHPLARALRADKTTLAALAATLRLYLGRDDVDGIPVLRMIRETSEQVRARAEALAGAIRSRLANGGSVEVLESRATVGGGSLPGQELVSAAVVLAPPSGAVSCEEALRAHDPPVIARISEDRVWLDCRTVLPDQVENLASAVASAMK